MLSSPLRDPLGNCIQLPYQVALYYSHNYEDISQVITEPSFIIQVKNEKLFFLRLITPKTNLLVEASAYEEAFVVSKCIENPTTEYISALLKRGALVSFQ